VTDKAPLSAVVIISCLGTLVISLASCLAERIPPRALTRTRMAVIRQRIYEYYAKSGKLPATLADLPEGPPQRDSSLQDGWGRPIQYAVEDKAVTLLSLGKDGRPGGTDDDSDIETEFVVPEPPSAPAPGP